MRQIGKKIVDGWCHFFFDPISPATVGLYRIAFGFIVFLSNLGHFPSREIFYGENAIVRYDSMNHMFPPHLPPWLYFRWMPLHDPALAYYFIALIFVNITFVLGLFSRLSNILLFLGVISLSNRNSFNENAGDNLMRINLFFLMFTNCGAAYSLDRFIKRKWGSGSLEKLKPISSWPIRLLQMQLVYVYLDTVYLKLPGKGWQDGTAMYYALNYLELRRFNLRFLFFNLWAIKFATYSTLIGEASIGLFIWFRKLRYWLIGLAIFLHEGINLTMQFPTFQYVMMTSIIIFVYPADAERFVAYLSKIHAKAHERLGFIPGIRSVGTP